MNFNPDGSRIAAVGDDSVVRVYDARTGQEVYALKAPTALSHPAVFSPDGACLAVTGRDGLVRVYDARTAEEVYALKAPARLLSVVFSPDGTRVTATAND